jgi:hypothetical protein
MRPCLYEQISFLHISTTDRRFGKGDPQWSIVVCENPDTFRLAFDFARSSNDSVPYRVL